ncbi:hypothetical protein DMA11_10925 [Marinilabiliaceae bacterium JC017]|nr:hypothetical protein DMA11_10925 [Marinilabiliaceae bacterium JC017]
MSLKKVHSVCLNVEQNSFWIRRFYARVLFCGEKSFNYRMALKGAVCKGFHKVLRFTWGLERIS